MARKKTEWPASAERKFARLAKKGQSAQQIAAELAADGVVGASAATVGRRLRELLGTTRASRTMREEPAGGDELPPLPDVVPDDAELDRKPVSLLAFWHAEAIAGLGLAKKQANLASHARFAEIGAKCAGAIQRASPSPVDLNAAPDMIARAEKCIALVFKKHDDQIAGRAP